MLLQVDGKPRGVRCDLTGAELMDKFEYYSLVGKMVSVDLARKVITQDTTASLDLDLSEAAYNEIYDIVKRNVGNTTPGTIKCDVSGKSMKGIFEYWTVSISHVKVDVSADPAMAVVDGIFDLNASAEEVMKWAVKAKENRAIPFVYEKPKKVLKLGKVDNKEQS